MISDMFRDINKYFFISSGDGQCARYLLCYTAVIKDSVIGLIMLYLQKSYKGFLVFVIHDNYLLQWYFTDIWCILHLKFNILVIFTKGSIRAVSTWPTCQCLCFCRIQICFCFKIRFCTNLVRKQEDSVVSKAQSLSFF